MSLSLDYQPLQGRVGSQGSYQTYSPAGTIGTWVHYFWQLDVPQGCFSYRSLPDCCVDWIFDLSDPIQSFVVAPFQQSVVFDLQGPATYFGVRFTIMGHHQLMSLPVGEWGAECSDSKASDLFSPTSFDLVSEALLDKADFSHRCETLSKVLLNISSPSLFGQATDRRLNKFVQSVFMDLLASDSSGLYGVSDIGLSERQLRRLSHLYLGLSPKNFSRILRFQKTFQSLNNTQISGGWRDNFYDQPHLIREFKKVSGLTPNQLLQMSVLYNT